MAGSREQIKKATDKCGVRLVTGDIDKNDGYIVKRAAVIREPLTIGFVA